MLNAAAKSPRISARRILIVLLGAIGDVTRALPLLQRLRRGYPDARISWAVEPASAGLLHNHPSLDQVLVFDRRRGARAFLPFLRSIRAIKPDLTLDLQRHLKSGVISRASGAPLRLGFDRRNGREGNWLFNTDTIAPQDHFTSKLQQFMRFGDWLGLPDGEVSFELVLSDEEQQHVEGLLHDVPRPFVAAFVGSSCEARLWFPERTAAVADELARQGVHTVLVGGPADVAYANDTANAAHVALTNLAGRTELRDLVGVFQRSAAAFGPDSGPMHIAAAVGKPVVSLWGATSALRSAPWGSEAGVIEGSAECMPCYRKVCPIGRICMQHIDVATVVERLRRTLSP
ncbi:MAG: glycosyltransferase family 9 protein [Deltaproteobacteria bacterium]|nr:glycosyltransferase family 9 protein [Deltaproteobacteria bacterium]